MPAGSVVHPALMRRLKSAGAGHPPRQAGELIVTAVLAHFNAEITVYDPNGNGELFRIGIGSPRHHIFGVHVHPLKLHSQTWGFIADRKAIALISDEHFNMYVGTLLQALETGRYRYGFD